ncbi:MAG: hemolysin III family protein [Gammaproteobacteria bacterium]|nr:MAG: hemolysin III family protein [Gammaproteobacteria bacterium]
MSNTPEYSRSEELMNTITHGAGCLLALVGLGALIARAEGTVEVVCAVVYGLSMVILFMASTLYHGLSHTRWKQWLKTLDHSAIYLLIAGSYTPFLLVSLKNWIGITMTVVIWALAVAGIGFKLLAGHRFPKVSLATYLLMGWLALVIIYPLYVALPGEAMWLLAGGGLLYTIGAVFYAMKNVPYAHAIWHLFVLGGASLHFASIYGYVLVPGA